MITEQISFFDSLSSSPRTIQIGQWIEYCTTGWMFERQIHEYRHTGDKNLKLSLPLVTVGAVCSGGRKRSNVIKKTGLIAIDIDYKDNTHIEDVEHLRNEIAHIAYVIYSGLSASGKGVWALLKVSDPNRLKDHFRQLRKDFKSFGITLDRTKGQNPNDARFLSFDPEGILKSEFKVYDRFPLKEEKLKSEKNRPKVKQPITCLDDIVYQVACRQLNIAPDYATYRNIGFALSDEYGEFGREYFHAIVCYSEKYNRREADIQYTNCMKSRRSGITIATLYYYLKENRISLPKQDTSDHQAINLEYFDLKTGEIWDAA